MRLCDREKAGNEQQADREEQEKCVAEAAEACVGRQGERKQTLWRSEKEREEEEKCQERFMCVADESRHRYFCWSL